MTGMRMLRIKLAAGIAAVAFVGLAGNASAQWWNPASPVAPGKWALAEKTFRYTPTIYANAIMTIEGAMNQGDFEKLDRMHDEFLAMELAGGNGRQMLGAFTDATRGGFAGEDPKRYAKLFSDWREKAPESKLRPALEAAMWMEFAWKARGGGYAGDVPDEAFKIFDERLARAAKVLEEGDKAGRKSPLWYDEAIAVAGSLGAPPAVLDALVEDGSERFPDFLPMYKTRVNYLLPQWGGNYDRIDAFIRRAVMKTQSIEGTAMYARLYDYVHGFYRGNDFFHETKASWRLMRHAFQDEVAGGQIDLNQYATYACIAEDKDTTRLLLRSLGERANLGVGMEGFSTDACMAMAEDGK